jgi:protein-disulfide isomerase
VSDQSAEAGAPHVFGDPTAPVRIIEYADFECPYCAAVAPVLHRLVERSDGRLRLEFRHFPLFDVHPHALTAALAAEAAGVAGRFWDLHDLLFANQDRLSDADLAGYATSLGLDGAAVVGEPAQRFAPEVRLDYARGIAEGVEGTPTIFVEGERFEGRPDLRALTEFVEAVTGR